MITPVTSGWSNWSGRQRSRPIWLAEPTSEADFIRAVELATTDDLKIRAVGAAHSHSRVAATDGILVTTDAWQGLISVDLDARQATFRSGTRIHQAGPWLFPHGLALANQGDIDQQSLAGAVATGTHGTGPDLGNLSSSVAAIRLVLASGEAVTTSPIVEPELFEVARLSLGGAGLVTELTFGLRDTYRLHERLWSEHPDDVLARIDDLVGASRHFEFFWLPGRDRCAVKTLTETKEATLDPRADRRRERIGWSHEIISSVRDEKHTEMEYAVPAENGPACFVELRQLILTEFPDLAWPLEYRTVASDDLWISPATQRPTVTISAHQDIALDDRPLFDACEDIFRRHQGRPHWGKVHSLAGHDLNELYPRYRDWWNVRNRVDHDGRFLTPELAALQPAT